MKSCHIMYVHIQWPKDGYFQWNGHERKLSHLSRSQANIPPWTLDNDWLCLLLIFTWVRPSLGIDVCLKASKLICQHDMLVSMGQQWPVPSTDSRIYCEHNRLHSSNWHSHEYSFHLIVTAWNCIFPVFTTINECMLLKIEMFMLFTSETYLFETFRRS